MMAFTGNEITLREAIEAMLKEYGLEERINQTHIATNWEKLMGQTINIRTQEVKLKKRKLYIRVNSFLLNEELHYERNKIHKLTNAEFEYLVAEEIVLPQVNPLALRKEKLCSYGCVPIGVAAVDP